MADACAGSKRRSRGRPSSMNSKLSVAESVSFASSDAFEATTASLRARAARVLWREHSRRGSRSPRTGRPRTPDWRRDDVPRDVINYLERSVPQVFIATTQPQLITRGASIGDGRSVTRLHRVVEVCQSSFSPHDTRLCSDSRAESETLRGVSSVGTRFGVSGGFGAVVRMYDLSTGLGVAHFKCTDSVSSIAGISTDAFLSGHTRTLRLFRVVPDDEEAVDAAGNESDANAATDPDPSAPRTANVQNRDARAPKVTFQLISQLSQPSTVTDINAMPRGRAMVTRSGGTLQIVAPASSQAPEVRSLAQDHDLVPVAQIQVSQEWLWAAACSFDGTTAISGVQGLGKVGVVDVEKQTVLREMQGHDKVVRSAVWSMNDMNIAFTGSYSGTVAIWDVRTPARVAEMPAPGVEGNVQLMKIAALPSGEVVGGPEYARSTLWCPRQRVPLLARVGAGAPLCVVRGTYPS